MRVGREMAGELTWGASDEQSYQLERANLRGARCGTLVVCSPIESKESHAKVRNRSAYEEKGEDYE